MIAVLSTRSLGLFTYSVSLFPKTTSLPSPHTPASGHHRFTVLINLGVLDSTYSESSYLVQCPQGPSTLSQAASKWPTDRSVERRSVSLIREVQIGTSQYHRTPVRMTVIKKSGYNKCWPQCGEEGTLVLCWWE